MEVFVDAKAGKHGSFRLFIRPIRWQKGCIYRGALHVLVPVPAPGRSTGTFADLCP